MSKFKKDGIKAKAALAKSNTVSATISGDYENDRQRFQALSQNMEVTYDSNNNVVTNGALTRIIELEDTSHVHSNSAILSLIEEAFTTALKTAYDGYENRIAELESRLANYEGHSHSYEDDNGTTVTTKTTSEVA
jgi:hypothetical protein